MNYPFTVNTFFSDSYFLVYSVGETESSHIMNNTDFRRKLGAVLRNKRLEKNFSLSYVGSLLGVSRNQVSHWELGKRSIYAESLHEYCRILGVSVQEVFDLMEEIK